MNAGLQVDEDTELQAIEQLLSALEPLGEDARIRVLDYVFRRLEMRALPAQESSVSEVTPLDARGGPSALSSPPAAPSFDSVVDIRTLADEKEPSSQIEKTVFVAFYLTEVAPESERQTEISGADLTKYQKQAGLGAPTNTRQALFRARDAGYLESAGHGKYKLNPVGYNLVAHGLPSEKAATTGGTRKRATRKSSKRSTLKKASKKKSRRT